MALSSSTLMCGTAPDGRRWHAAAPGRRQIRQLARQPALAAAALLSATRGGGGSSAASAQSSR
eukprot:11165596-Lingulodinium_polyedra.AAC.1